MGEEVNKKETSKKEFIVSGLMFTGMALVMLVVLVRAIPLIPMIKSESAIEQGVDKIEQVSYQTYDLIKKKYNIVGNDSVSIEYSEDGSTIKVEEDDYYQRYEVDFLKNVSDKESDEEFIEYKEIRGYVDNYRDAPYLWFFLSMLVMVMSMMGYLGVDLLRNGVKKQ